ncbi:MAG: hypothetical protein HQ472_02285 [Ignavibacteria bacterium]|nr:hypothetical protein [Ignavibacteria bacterium]
MNEVNNFHKSFEVKMGAGNKRYGGGSIIGILLVIVGGGLLLDAFNILEFGDMLHMWWPSALMVIALVQIASGSGSIVGSGVLFTVGALIQLGKLDYLPGGFWSAFWPIVIILIGVSLIMSKRKKKLFTDPLNVGQISVDGSRIDRTAFFGGADCQVVSDDFTGGNLTAVFGGVKADFRNANIKNGTAILNITAVFGGVELRVPDGWIVIVRGTPIFGGIDESARRKIPNINEPGPTLIVDCTVVFGGIEIS